MYVSFCSTANSISQLYTRAMNQQKLSFHVGECNALENFIGGFGNNKKEGQGLGKLIEDELKAWDVEFVKVDQVTLFDPILVVNYLNIKNLLDLACQTVADMIKGKTPEEIRRTFNIKNDFTLEEEEEVRCENQREIMKSDE
ncbi:unnamed protein product [Vicia faba]|uniref:SKP1 component dimerisation domain-containing protein n=1 Tax=Vicia faba TaxID=3906 RepID=A0AAV1BDH1_VICFA|nr:unnamed protein product [Vicia faba]